MGRRGIPDPLRRSCLFSSLYTPVELEPKRPAKGRQCPFGRIRLGSFESRVVHLARVFPAPFTGPMSLPDNARAIRLDGEPDLGRVHGREVAAVLAREHAFGLERLPAPAVKPKDAVCLRDDEPALQIRELASGIALAHPDVAPVHIPPKGRHLFA